MSKLLLMAVCVRQPYLFLNFILNMQYGRICMRVIMSCAQSVIAIVSFYVCNVYVRNNILCANMFIFYVGILNY